MGSAGSKVLVNLQVFCEELLYWGDGIRLQSEEGFTGVKGSVAFSFKLWFSVLGYLCVNLQQESPLLLDFCSIVAGWPRSSGERPSCSKS